MCSLRIVALLLVSAVSHAETVSVLVDAEGWNVTFSLPEHVQFVASPSPSSGKHYSIGRGTRFNVSLFVGAPTCEGGTAASAAYRCMSPKIYAVPGVVEESISVESRPGTVQVSYIQYAKAGDVAVKIMHTHVLFEKNGLWGDLHVSTVKPSTAEVAALLAIGDKFEVR